MLTTERFDPQALVEALRERGAAACRLVEEPALLALAAAARALEYEPQPEAVGPPERRVRQRLASLQLGADPGPFAALARALGALARALHEEVRHSPWSAPPAFNDFLVQRYPPGPFALTPHLDGRRYTDLVAVAVLEGEARFCVCADRVGNGRREIPAPPGHVIFMRAPGFDGAADGRPFHCVLDVQVERYTFGLRHNSRI